MSHVLMIANAWNEIPGLTGRDQQAARTTSCSRELYCDVLVYASHVSLESRGAFGKGVGKRHETMLPLVLHEGATKPRGTILGAQWARVKHQRHTPRIHVSATPSCPVKIPDYPGVPPFTTNLPPMQKNSHSASGGWW